MTESTRPPAEAVRVDVDALQRDLRAAISGDVRFDVISRALYSNDASVYEIRPAGVVIVKNRDDVVRTIEICARHRCPLTMRGGGTSQAGQAIGSGVIVDTSKYFNRVLEVNAAERWARVEPGIVLDELNAALAPHRLRFAPDISTASRATLGGMMANNSSGARSILYGKTIDHVLEQQVVLSDGSVADFRPLTAGELDAVSAGSSREAACYREVRRLAATHADEIGRRYPKVLRRVGGYNLDAFVETARPFNLAKLMVGSEGTLGVVVEARIALVPLPAAKAVMVVQFDNLLDALAATPAILTHGPSAVEVMDAFILDHTAGNAALHRVRQAFVTGNPAAILCIEFYADRQEDLPPRLDALQEDLERRRLGSRFHRALDAVAQRAIWGVREAALGLSMAMPGDAKSISFVEDTAVAPEHLRAYITRFLDLIRRHGTTAGIYAHASVGCLHVRPVVNLKTADGVRQFEALANDVANLVLEFGGALSGEHGDGLVRSPFMARMFGPVLYDAFRQIKRTFDPDGIFNPGKIVDAASITSNLRYGAQYRTTTPATSFNYANHGGFAGAVEMCSGLGACRKTIDGVMCPSYMVTREEAHSTRGRANVLRLALAGRLSQAGLDDDGIFGVLDLCLECRACKSECPVGVDMARFKSEFLAQYWRRHGTPLRSRLLGGVAGVSRWGSRLAPVSNWIAHSGAGRWLNEKTAGIDRRRRPPAWARRTFARRFRRRAQPAPRGHVVLFNDTFTNHLHPGIGVAAHDVLHAAGFDVALAPNVCCGRPLISQGHLDAATALARGNTDRLHPIAMSGATIVCLEPSCLSALREDAPALLTGEVRRRAELVATRTRLLEEFLDEAIAAGAAELRFRPGPSKIVLHGHCHQKSMGALTPAKSLLARVPGAAVVDLDAGCCGMAGSFGYATEHYDVSRAIGERRLLPAARALAETEVLVASGTSCRQQIADFTSVRALHTAELLSRLLVP